MMEDLKEYIDLKADEWKLRATKGLSLVSSRISAIFLLTGLLVIVLGLLSLVLIAWIGEWTGSLAIAVSIVLGIFLVVLILLFCMRRHLFRDTFVKLFIRMFYDEDKP